MNVASVYNVGMRFSLNYKNFKKNQKRVQVNRVLRSYIKICKLGCCFQWKYPQNQPPHFSFWRCLETWGRQLQKNCKILTQKTRVYCKVQLGLLQVLPKIFSNQSQKFQIEFVKYPSHFREKLRSASAFVPCNKIDQSNDKKLTLTYHCSRVRFLDAKVLSLMSISRS